MKKFFISALIVSPLLMFAGTSPAGEVSQSQPSDPLSMERWFVGDWVCKGTQQMSPHGPEIKFTDKFVFRMVLDDTWLLFHIDQLEGPLKGKRSLIGSSTWDAYSHLHIRRDMNIGSSRMDMTTPGWAGDRLVFSGFMTTGDDGLAVEQVFTRKTAAEYEASMKVTDAAGTVLAWEEEDCRRIRSEGPKISGH